MISDPEVTVNILKGQMTQQVFSSDSAQACAHVRVYKFIAILKTSTETLKNDNRQE